MKLDKIIRVALIVGTVSGVFGVGNALKAIEEEKPWAKPLLYLSEAVYIIRGSLKIVSKKDKNDKIIHFY